MNPTLIAGTRIVVLALICYTVAIWTEQRQRLVNNRVLIFLTLGVLLDIVSTVLMILGSSNSPFTLHGFLGYTALLAMLVDAFLLWKQRIFKGRKKAVSKQLHLYSRYAYLWWVVAFVTGSMIILVK